MFVFQMTWAFNQTKSVKNKRCSIQRQASVPELHHSKR